MHFNEVRVYECVVIYSLTFKGFLLFLFFFLPFLIKFIQITSLLEKYIPKEKPLEALLQLHRDTLYIQSFFFLIGS